MVKAKINIIKWTDQDLLSEKTFSIIYSKLIRFDLLSIGKVRTDIDMVL